MRIFITGATGFIGSALVPELIRAGHQVIGLTRSAAGAQAVEKASAQPHLGNLEDLASLRSGAAQADAVIHLAFDHDNMANFEAICEKDRQAIGALGAELAGSDRLLLITSGTPIGSPGSGKLALEDYFDPNMPHPRIASELAGLAASERGTKVSVVRLPQVHDPVKQGLITMLIPNFIEKAACAYVGDGSARWPAAHVSDVARLYRLAIEKQAAGARYHAVAEEGIPLRDIAEVIARGLNVSVKSIPLDQANDYFGWLSLFAGYDMPASGARTQAALNWHPTGPGLIADLEKMDYAALTPAHAG